MNRVEISGRLTRDPEVRYLGDARFPVLSLNMAVDDGSGRWNRETKKTEYSSGFYQVEVPGNYGEYLSQVLTKGDEVYVLGSLSQFTRQNREGESSSHTRIRGVVVNLLDAQRQPRPPIAPPSEPPLTDPDPWETPSKDAGSF